MMEKIGSGEDQGDLPTIFVVPPSFVLCFGGSRKKVELQDLVFLFVKEKRSHSAATAGE